MNDAVGAGASTVTVLVLVLDPAEFLTVSVTVYLPGVAYVTLKGPDKLLLLGERGVGPKVP